jgi:aldose 1-epimerase
VTPLEADGWRLELLPEIGGAIGRLAFQGLDVLRPAALQASDPLDTACFPMVPFANRVANGSFTFGGRRISVPVLDRFHPHALHGEAWLRPWSVVTAGGRSATLEFRGGVGGWPWPYMSRQTITLGRRQAIIGLELTNTGATVMPAGLGLHPYFLTGPDARLTFNAEGAWLGEAGGIPQKIGAPAELFDFSGGPTRANAPSLDHCYVGLRGAAIIDDGSRTIRISATPNASWAHVYSPKGQGFWCFEPMTHRPDALNSPEGETSGVARLRPGETMAMSMTISVG